MGKSKKNVFICVLVLLCVATSLLFFACTEEQTGDSPIESLVVTTLPKTNYYRGDMFDVTDAVLTVYYQNGAVESIPLTMNMISNFDSNKVGRQILTVSYKDATTYLTINISSAPVYSVTLASLPDKTTYIIGEELDVTGMKIKVTYSNNYTDILDVTADMISSFSTQNEGETSMSILYSGKYCTCAYSVEKKKVVNVQTVLGNDFCVNYVVGDRLDLTDGSFFVMYNDNTSEYLDWVKLDENKELIVWIDKEENRVFTTASVERTVTLQYNGNRYQILVGVSSLSPKTMTLIAYPHDQVMKGNTDLTGGQVHVTYNSTLTGYTARVIDATDLALSIATSGQWKSNYSRFFTFDGKKYVSASNSHSQGTTYYLSAEAEYKSSFALRVPVLFVQKGDSFVPATSYSDGTIYYIANNSRIYDLTDPVIEIQWNDFNINEINQYTIGVQMGKIAVNCPINVIAPTPEKLEIIPSTDDVFYDGEKDVYYLYQDESIDITKWTYQIQLNNGLYMSIASGYSAPVTQSMYSGNIGFTNHKVGTYTYSFSYTPSSSETLRADVSIEVRAREIIALEITLPDKKIYSVGDPLRLTGGKVKATYNNGSVEEGVAIGEDMLVDDSGKQVTDSTYYTAVDGETKVYVRYTDSFYDTAFTASFTIQVILKASSIELNTNITTKNDYILSEEFTSENWEVYITYADNSVSSPVRDFSGAEWTFENTALDSVGTHIVKLYYGDKEDNIFIDYSCTVHNEIKSLSLNKNTVSDTTEGTDYDFSGITLTVTRENDATEEYAVTKSMIKDYKKAGVFNTDSTKNNITMTVLYDCPVGVTLPTITAKVISRKIVSAECTTQPQTEYVGTESTWNFTSASFIVTFNNNTTAVWHYSGNTYFTANNINYTFELGYTEEEVFTSYALATLKSGLGAEEEYADKEVRFRFIDPQNNNATFLTEPFFVYYFKNRVTALMLQVGGATTSGSDITAVTPYQDQTVYINQGKTFLTDSGFVLNDSSAKEDYLAHMTVKITYEGGSVGYRYLNDLNGSAGFSLTGYNAQKAGMQTVTISYLLCTCSFNVYVRADVVDSVLVCDKDGEVSEISVVEGKAIDASRYHLRAYTNDADGVPTGRYIQVDLGNVTCSYNKDTPVTFTLRGADNRYYYTAVHTATYQGKTDSFTLKILKKKAVSITMMQMPQYIYPESTTPAELNLTDGKGKKGSVLIRYDNDTTQELELENAKIEINKSAFKTNIVLENNAQQVQTIYIRFTDENNVSVETSYNVNVCDRRYLTIEFTDESTYFVENVFRCQYGTGIEAGPQYKVYYYADFEAIEKTECSGYTVSYLNQTTGIEQSDWPKEVGKYTLIIRYAGDKNNNPYLFDQRYIQVTKRSIGIVMSDIEIEYGSLYTSVSDIFGEEGTKTSGNWYMSGVVGSVLSGDPYVYGDTEVVSVSFRIYNNKNQLVSFTTGDGYLVVTESVGTYTVVPIISTTSNYQIAEGIGANGCTLTITQKPIRLTALNAQKVYGDADPVFEFRVYDASNNPIGGCYYEEILDFTAGSPITGYVYTYMKVGEVVNYVRDMTTYQAGKRYFRYHSALTLGGRYEDTVIGNYRLTRAVGENVADEHIISANDFAGFLDNYKLDSYQSAKLTIYPASLYIGGNNVSRSFGTASTEFIVGLKAIADNGMKNGDLFESIFSQYFYDYQNGKKINYYLNLSRPEEGPKTEIPAGDYYDNWAVLYRNILIEGMDTLTFNNATYTVLPIASACGTYTCTICGSEQKAPGQYVSSIFGALPNYEIYTDDFRLEITPVSVELNVGSVIVYEESAVKDGTGNKFIDYIDFSEYESYFIRKNYRGTATLTKADFVYSVADRALIDSDFSTHMNKLLLGAEYGTEKGAKYGLSPAYLIGFSFTKAEGTDTGIYKINILSDASPNFSSFTLKSVLPEDNTDFISFYYEIISQGQYTLSQLAGDYSEGAYMMVLPSLMDFRCYYGDTVGTLSENYSRKSINDWSDGITKEYGNDKVTYRTYDESFDAIRLSLVADNGSTVEYLNAGLYRGTVSYSFFADIEKETKFSTDYLYLDTSWVTNQMLQTIFEYIFNGTIGTLTYSKNFSYVVTKRPIRVALESNTTNYDFDDQTFITLVDDALAEYDTLNFTYSVQVKYNQRENYETVLTYINNIAYDNKTTFTSSVYFTQILLTEGDAIPHIGDGNTYYERISDVSRYYIRTMYGAFELTTDTEYDETKTYYERPTEGSEVNPYYATEDLSFHTDKTYYARKDGIYSPVTFIYENTPSVQEVDDVTYEYGSFALTADATVQADKKYYTLTDNSGTSYSLSSSGNYKIVLSDIGNENYCLSDDSVTVATYTVTPNVIPVLLYKTGQGGQSSTTEFIFSATYSGEEQQPFEEEGWTETTTQEKLTDTNVDLSGVTSTEDTVIGSTRYNGVIYDVYIAFDESVSEISNVGGVITDTIRDKDLSLGDGYSYYILYKNQKRTLAYSSFKWYVTYGTYKTVNSLIVSSYFNQEGILCDCDPLTNAPNNLTLYADDGEGKGNYPIYVKRNANNLEEILGYEIGYNINSEYVDYSVVFVYRKADGSYAECDDTHRYTFVIMPHVANLSSFSLINSKTYDGKEATVSNDDIGAISVMNSLSKDPIIDYTKIRFEFDRITGEKSTYLNVGGTPYTLISADDKKSVGKFAVRAYYVKDYQYALQNATTEYNYQINYELRFKDDDGILKKVSVNNYSDADEATGVVNYTYNENGGTVTIDPVYQEYSITQNTVKFQFYGTDAILTREYDGYGLAAESGYNGDKNATYGHDFYSGNLAEILTATLYSGTMIDSPLDIYYKMVVNGYASEFYKFTVDEYVTASELSASSSVKNRLERFMLNGVDTAYKTGYYSYAFRGMFKYGDDYYAFSDADGGYTDWLSWNYKFTVRKINNNIPDAVDGIYYMNTRKIYFALGDELPEENGSKKYTYYLDYDGTTHDKTNIDLSGKYTFYIYENNTFVPLASQSVSNYFILNEAGNICPRITSSAKITNVNTKESVPIDMSALITANPDFQIVNQEASIMIQALEVELMLTLVNTTDGNASSIVYGKTIRENALSYTLSVSEEQLALFNEAMNGNYTADEMLALVSDLEKAEYYLYGNNGTFGRIFTFRVKNNSAMYYLYNAVGDYYYLADEGALTDAIYYSKNRYGQTTENTTKYYEYYERLVTAKDATVQEGTQYYSMTPRVQLTSFSAGSDYYEKVDTYYTLTKDRTPIANKTYYTKTLVHLTVGSTIGAESGIYQADNFFAVTEDEYFKSAKTYYTATKQSVLSGDNVKAETYFIYRNQRFEPTADRTFVNGIDYYTMQIATVSVGKRIVDKLYIQDAGTGNWRVFNSSLGDKIGDAYVFTADIRADEVLTYYYYFDPSENIFKEAVSIDNDKNYYIIMTGTTTTGTKVSYFTAFERMEKATGTAQANVKYYSVHTPLYCVGEVISSLQKIYEKEGDCYYQTQDDRYLPSKEYYCFSEETPLLGASVTSYYLSCEGFSTSEERFTEVVQAIPSVDYQIYDPIPSKGFFVKDNSSDDSSGIYTPASGTFSEKGVYYRLKGYYGITIQNIPYVKSGDNFILNGDEYYQANKSYYLFTKVQVRVGGTVLAGKYYHIDTTTGEMVLTEGNSFFLADVDYYTVETATVTVGAKCIDGFYEYRNGAYYLTADKVAQPGKKYYTFAVDNSLSVSAPVRFYEKTADGYVETSDFVAQADKEYYYFKQSSVTALRYDYTLYPSVNYIVGDPVASDIYTYNGNTYQKATGNYLSGVNYYRRSVFSVLYTDGGQTFTGIVPGTYYTAANNFGKNGNFKINVVSTTFTIEKQVIKVIGAERNYYSVKASDYSFITDDETESNATIQNILNNLLTQLTDTTFEYSPVGIYTIGLNANFVNSFNSQSGQMYTIDYEGVLQNGIITLPFYIRKLPITIGVTVGEIQYGIAISTSEFNFVIEAPQDNKKTGEQSNAVDDMLKYIRSDTVDLSTLSELIAQTKYSTKQYSVSLLYYLTDDFETINSVYTNYELNFGEIEYVIIKRQIPIYVTVNKTYYQDGDIFSVLYSDRDKMYYSAGADDMLSYGINIDNFVSAGRTYNNLKDKIFEIIDNISEVSTKIQYEGSYYNSVNDMLKNITRYNLCAYEDGSGVGEIMAGLNYICLNNDWYTSSNYVLLPTTRPIMIYPEIGSLGENTVTEKHINMLSDTEVAYSNTITVHPTTKEVSGLSFMLLLNMEGMKVTRTIAGTNVTTDYSAQYYDTSLFRAYTDLTYELNGESYSYYDGIAYNRSIKIYYAGSGTPVINVGTILPLKVVVTEKFFKETADSNEYIRNYELESMVFNVRIAERITTDDIGKTSDVTLIADKNTSVLYNNVASEVFRYGSTEDLQEGKYTLSTNANIKYVPATGTAQSGVVYYFFTAYDFGSQNNTQKTATLQNGIFYRQANGETFLTLNAEEYKSNYTYYTLSNKGTKTVGSDLTGYYTVDSLDGIEGLFDVLSIRVQLSPDSGKTDYGFTLTLYENAKGKLDLVIKGGNGKSVYLNYRDNTLATDVQQNIDYNSIADLFDGKSHDIIVYLDKVGHLTDMTNTTTALQISDEGYYKLSSSAESYCAGITYFTANTVVLTKGTKLYDGDGKALYYVLYNQQYIMPRTLFAEEDGTYYTFCEQSSVTAGQFSGGSYYRFCSITEMEEASWEEKNERYYSITEFHLSAGEALFAGTLPYYFQYNSVTKRYEMPSSVYVPAGGGTYYQFTETTYSSSEKRYKMYKETRLEEMTSYCSTLTYYTVESVGQLPTDTDVIGSTGDILYYLYENGVYVAPKQKKSDNAKTYYQITMVRLASSLEMQRGINEGVHYYIMVSNKTLFTMITEYYSAQHTYYVYMQIDSTVAYAGGSATGVVETFVGGDYSYFLYYSEKDEQEQYQITDETLFLSEGVQLAGKTSVAFYNTQPIISRYTVSARKAVVVTNTASNEYFLRNVVFFPTRGNQNQMTYLLSDKTFEDVTTMISNATDAVFFYNVSGNQQVKDAYLSGKSATMSTCITAIGETSCYSYATNSYYTGDAVKNLQSGMYRIEIPFRYYYGDNTFKTVTERYDLILTNGTEKEERVELYAYSVSGTVLTADPTSLSTTPSASKPVTYSTETGGTDYYFNLRKYYAPSGQTALANVSYVNFIEEKTVTSDAILFSKDYYYEVSDGVNSYFVENVNPYQSAITYYSMNRVILAEGTRLYNGTTPLYYVDNNPDISETRSSTFVFETSFVAKKASTLWLYLGMSNPQMFGINGTTHDNLTNQSGVALQITNDVSGTNAATLFLSFVVNERETYYEGGVQQERDVKNVQVFSQSVVLKDENGENYAIDWTGKRNILKVDYMKEEGVIAIRLYQYFKNAQGSYVTQFVWQDFIRSSTFNDIGKENVRYAIENMKYVGYAVKNASVTLYQQTIKSALKTDIDFVETKFAGTSEDLYSVYDFVSVDDSMQTEVSLRTDNGFNSFLYTATGDQYILCDEYGIPYGYTGNSIRLKYSIQKENEDDDDNFIWYFGSATPYLSTIGALTSKMRQRGLMLQYKNGMLSFEFYKYNVNYHIQYLNVRYTPVNLTNYTVQENDNLYEYDYDTYTEKYYYIRKESGSVLNGTYYRKFDPADGQEHTFTVSISDRFMYNYTTEEQLKYENDNETGFDIGFNNYLNTTTYGGVKLSELMAETEEWVSEIENKSWSQQLASDLCRYGNNGFRLVTITIDDSVTTTCVCPYGNSLQTVTEGHGGANDDTEDNTGRDDYFLDGVYYTGVRMASPMTIYELITFNK